MLISMTPNDEVKTIHASLNDGSLRKWEFEPYTEQGKIELTDQDYATIQSIKGNTVKFNQLVGTDPNGLNTTNGTTISVNTNGGFNVSGTGTGNHFCEWATTIHPDFKFITGHKYFYKFKGLKSGIIGQILSGADGVTTKYHITTGVDATGILNYTDNIYTRDTIRFYTTSGYSGNTTVIMQVTDLTAIFGSGNEPSTVDEFETWLSNNIGLLPYYDYTPGTLIPFRGTGLKTTGKNLLNVNAPTLNAYIGSDGTIVSSANNEGVIIPLIHNTDYVLKWNRVSITSNADDCTIILTDEYPAGNVVGYGRAFTIAPTVPITFNSGIHNYVFIKLANINNTNFAETLANSQLEFGSTASEYEPYVENTLSLEALNTLFPTGMKSAGSVYDELTESRAYTRIGEVDLGTLNYNRETWTDSGITYVRFRTTISGMKAPSSGSIGADGLLMSDGKYIPRAEATTRHLNYSYWKNDNSEIFIYDNAYASASDFKTAMSGVMLCYGLATPTETTINPPLDLTYPIWNNGTEQILPINGSTPTTSPMVATIDYPDRTEEVNFLYKQTTFESAIPQFSLVCKNQELPMTLNDGKLICECDSSITNESGFFDCKVKMQDLDSVAYSQKIQLHVERGIND